jgi:GNAT superfamily N-acetyltransferase
VIDALTLPVTLHATAQDVVLRRADLDDLAALVRLLADDPVSAGRGDRADEADSEAYRSGLTRILEDPSNEALVVVNGAGDLVGTMQLTRIPGMARRGTTRLLVEAVRVRSDHRSGGIGAAMMRWVVDTAAPAAGSSLVQLTSDEARKDAHRFYERLGFVGSHRGFKHVIG